MKVGVLGFGSIGNRHARNLRDLGQVVLAFDPDDDMRLKQKAEDLGVRLLPRDDILSQSDAFVIATPTPFHYRDLIDCMAAGKPTFVEKPIASTFDEWRDLHCYQSTLDVMVGTNLRMHPCIQMAKRWIAEGSIGRPLWAHFNCCALSAKAPYLSDGVILNTGAHEVDVALHLLGPATVASAYARSGEYGDELAHFVLEHDSGAVSSFNLNFITPNEIREFWIAGEDDNIGIDLPSRHITCMRLGSSIGPGNYDLDYKNEMRAFIDRIGGKITPGASGLDGLATLKVLLDVRKKAGLA